MQNTSRILRVCLYLYIVYVSAFLYLSLSPCLFVSLCLCFFVSLSLPLYLCLCFLISVSQSFCLFSPGCASLSPSLPLYIPISLSAPLMELSITRISGPYGPLKKCSLRSQESSLNSHPSVHQHHHGHHRLQQKMFVPRPQCKNVCPPLNVKMFVPPPCV